MLAIISIILILIIKNITKNLKRQCEVHCYDLFYFHIFYLLSFFLFFILIFRFFGDRTEIDFKPYITQVEYTLYKVVLLLLVFWIFIELRRWFFLYTKLVFLKAYYNMLYSSITYDYIYHRIFSKFCNCINKLEFVLHLRLRNYRIVKNYMFCFSLFFKYFFFFCLIIIFCYELYFNNFVLSSTIKYLPYYSLYQFFYSCCHFSMLKLNLILDAETSSIIYNDECRYVSGLRHTYKDRMPKNIKEYLNYLLL